jgi:hypothetical protein
LGTSKNVTWQEYNGTDYDVLLPQPSVATADRVGGIIADPAEVQPQFESQFECKISQRTKKLLMPTSINPNTIGAPVPITKGGTDATTANDAKINLGIKDYITSIKAIGNARVINYKNNIQEIFEQSFNNSQMSLSQSVDNGKWYTSEKILRYASTVNVGNMSTWRYWKLEIVPVMNDAGQLPMFTVLQAGYDEDSDKIPFRLFSSTSQIFNPGTLQINLHIFKAP